MSDAISTVNGRAEMMYTGEKPWHGLGVELPSLATAAEALKAAHLDWQVGKRPVYFKDDKTGKMEAVRDRYAIIRLDIQRGLGVCGKDWQPLQNSEAFSFTDAIIQEKMAVYETAGALQGGRKVWVLARLDGVMTVKGDDVVNKYLLLSNSHEGGHAFTVKLTSVRVVCWNTLCEAMQSQGSLMRIQHCASMGDKIAAAREALGVANKQFAELELKMRRLAEVKVTTANFEVFAETLGWKPDSDKTRDKNDMADLVRAFETAPGQNLEGAKGTLWGAVNAVTYYVDHGTKYQETASISSADNRLRNVWFNGGSELKSLALETALVMAKK